MTAWRHPVADLLTDEMRARVRAARFFRDDDPDREWCATVAADVDGILCCPMGVALGGGENDHPSTEDIADALGLRGDVRAEITIQRFVDLVDLELVDNPSDVYVLLGCEPMEISDA